MKPDCLTAKISLPVIATLLCLLLFPATNSAQEERWLSYFPSVVRLHGKLIQITKYGSPTYGAEPDKDEAVEVPILILQKPIRVRAKPESTSNNESITNVSFVQLLFSDDNNATVKRYLDHEIVVAGTLSIGRRMGQFTEVVMTVKAVNPTGKPF